MKNNIIDRIIIITLFILLIGCSIFAQTTMGITLDKTISRAVPQSRTFGTSEGLFAYDFGFMNQSTDYSFGVSFYSNFTKLFLKVDALYRQTTTTFMIMDYKAELSMDPIKVNEKASHVHVPIIAGFNMGQMKIGAGSFFNFHLENDNNLSKSYPFDNKNRKMDTGMLLMVGYNIGSRLLVHARYEKAFVNIGNHYYYNHRSTRIKSTMDNISIGVTVYPGKI